MSDSQPNREKTLDTYEKNFAAALTNSPRRFSCPQFGHVCDYCSVDGSFKRRGPCFTFSVATGPAPNCPPRVSTDAVVFDERHRAPLVLWDMSAFAYRKGNHFRIPKPPTAAQQNIVPAQPELIPPPLPPPTPSLQLPADPKSTTGSGWPQHSSLGLLPSFSFQTGGGRHSHSSRVNASRHIQRNQVESATSKIFRYYITNGLRMLSRGRWSLMPSREVLWAFLGRERPRRPY